MNWNKGGLKLVLFKAWVDVFHGKLHECIETMEGYIGGIAFPTNVTLGKCIPRKLCVVDVYLTNT